MVPLHAVLQLKELKLIKDSALDWLIDYFSKKGTIPDNIESVNYFEAGLIDSLGVVILIEELETEFEIRFNEEHFQDRRFSTLKGLSDIINNLKEV